MIKTVTFDLLKELANKYSLNIQSQISNKIAAARSHNTLVSSFKNIILTNRRNYLNNLTKEFLEKNENILAFWLDSDKDKCDGRDDEFRGVYPFSKTGRISVVGWHRYSRDVAPLVIVDAEASLTADYHTIPRRKKRSDNRSILLFLYWK